MALLAVVVPVGIGLMTVIRLVLRSWPSRVAVRGSSMEPMLRSGDWLLVDPGAYARRAPVAGELVVVPDPRDPVRIMVKRVETVEADGRLRMAGDRAEASTDSRTFGPLDPSTVRGRVWARYWPQGRIGLLRRSG